MKTKQEQKNIPDGWTKKRLDEVADFFNGKGHEKDIDENGDYVVVNSKFISSNGKVKKHSNKFLVPLEKGDVTMVMSDVPNGKAIAKCFLVDKDKTYTLNQRIGGFKAKNISNKFLYLGLNRNRYFLSFDDGVNQTNLRKDDILACLIKFPPLPEQNRIVAVLETWDSGIEKLKQKISIKKEIKKGLMQELLTGKKRLPGFSDEWKNHEIGEMLEYEQPTNYLVSSTDYSDEFKTPVLTAGKTFLLGYTDEQDDIYNNGPVIIFDDFTTASKYVDFEFKVKSSAMKMLTPKKGYNLRFIYERMQLLCLPQGEHKRRYLSEYQYLACKVPNRDEQNAIVKIIKACDDEITTLEKKLTLWQEQKKYLLNNLVTGQIRTPKGLKL